MDIYIPLLMLSRVDMHQQSNPQASTNPDVSKADMEASNSKKKEKNQDEPDISPHDDAGSREMDNDKPDITQHHANSTSSPKNSKDHGPSSDPDADGMIQTSTDPATDQMKNKHKPETSAGPDSSTGKNSKGKTPNTSGEHSNDGKHHTNGAHTGWGGQGGRGSHDSPGFAPPGLGHGGPVPSTVTLFTRTWNTDSLLTMTTTTMTATAGASRGGGASSTAALSTSEVGPPATFAPGSRSTTSVSTDTDTDTDTGISTAVPFASVIPTMIPSSLSTRSPSSPEPTSTLTTSSGGIESTTQTLASTMAQSNPSDTPGASTNTSPNQNQSQGRHHISRGKLAGGITGGLLGLLLLLLLAWYWFVFRRKRRGGEGFGKEFDIDLESHGTRASMTRHERGESGSETPAPAVSSLARTSGFGGGVSGIGGNEIEGIGEDVGRIGETGGIGREIHDNRPATAPATITASTSNHHPGFQQHPIHRFSPAAAAAAVTTTSSSSSSQGSFAGATTATPGYATPHMAYNPAYSQSVTSLRSTMPERSALLQTTTPNPASMSASNQTPGIMMPGGDRVVSPPPRYPDVIAPHSHSHSPSHSPSPDSSPVQGQSFNVSPLSTISEHGYGPDDNNPGPGPGPGVGPGVGPAYEPETKQYGGGDRKSMTVPQVVEPICQLGQTSASPPEYCESAERVVVAGHEGNGNDMNGTNGTNVMNGLNGMNDFGRGERMSIGIAK
ncbi:hypothetical protein GGR50DRAFT_678501 [Xylaria sp. CBS 124048]|nr:hypothetical protein GGR50DRAFT_678501 [Xylaria sp. CBS 124048]